MPIAARNHGFFASRLPAAKRSALALQALLASVGLLIAFAWSMAWWTASTDRTGEAARVDREHVRLADAFASEALRTVEAADHALRAVQADGWAATSLTAEVARSGHRILSIARYSADGALVQSSRPVPHKPSLTDAALLGVVLGGEIGAAYAGRPMIDPVTGVQAWPVLRQLHDENGKLTGFALAMVNPRAIESFARMLGVEPATSVFVIGEDGAVRMQAHLDALAVDPQEVVAPAFEQARTRLGGTLSIALGRGARPAAVGFYRIDAHGALAIVATPSESAFAAMYTRNHRRVLAAMMATGLLLILGILGVRAVHALESALARAEAADRSKSQWLADVSHELRTPLNGILGFAEYLHRRLSAPLERESAAHILASGRHLHAVVNGLLDFARLEAGRLEFAMTDEALEELVLDARTPHQHIASLKGIAFDTLIDAACPKVIRCDRTRLVGMLGNLLDNAVKFTELGRVSLLVRPSHVAVGALDFVVTDTGPGIAPEHQQRVFERFHRGGAGNRGTGGTGLGLAYVREIANAMGGALELVSRPGRGATFILRLPTSPGEAADGRAPETAPETASATRA